MAVSTPTSDPRPEVKAHLTKIFLEWKEQGERMDEDFYQDYARGTDEDRRAIDRDIGRSDLGRREAISLKWVAR